MGEIPNFTDSERFQAPKTRLCAKSSQRQRVLSAWIPGLLTLKIQGSMPPQASSLNAFVISKTRIVAQKPRGRQLNAKVCGSKSQCHLSLRLLFKQRKFQALTLNLAQNGCSSQHAASQPLSDFIASNSPWSIRAIHSTLWLLSVTKDAIF